MLLFSKFIFLIQGESLVKNKPRLALSTNNLLFLQLEPWLGLLIVLAIALTFTEFTTHLDANYIEIALAVGIVGGIIVERRFDPETLFVGGFIGSMVIAFILMLLLIPLDNSLFETCFILTATSFLVAIASIVVQWLIRNWICRSWGRLWGIILSAITISLGIIFAQPIK